MHLQEKDGAKYKWASVQLKIQNELALEAFRKLQDRIPDEALVRDFPLIDGEEQEGESRGKENDPHVTVLYGLSPSVSILDMQEASRGFGPFKLRAMGVNYFEAKDCRVAFLDILSEDLENLNAHLKALFEVPGQTFPEYDPHMTLAYVKKGYDVNSSLLITEFDFEEFHLELSFPGEAKYQLTF